MSAKREDIVDIILSWKGLKESDGSFKPIIDIYNSITPLPRNYLLKYTDVWSAGTVSAAYKQAGIDDIFPCECGLDPMICKAKCMGVWIEDDAYTPKIADACMFDDQDNDCGDNRGYPDHVGIVVSVDRGSRTFVVVEGNLDHAVGSKTMSMNGRYIRGFISPQFEEDRICPIVVPEAPTITTTETTCTVKTPVQVVGTGTLSKVAAGALLKLENTPMYASASAKHLSSYKTGNYYIWSVDTVNGRVRITNSPKNIGVKGQVTGWIDVSIAIELNKCNASVFAAADIPAYEVNAVYVVQFDDVVVRRGPGTSYEPVGYAGLTANAKKYDKNKTGCLFRGVKVTCQAIECIGSNVWMKIPSGWIAAYYDKKYFVK